MDTYAIMLKVLVMLAVLLTAPDTKAYWNAAFAPANASNWILAVLGIAGGVMALVTLLIIGKQLSEMRRQRIAMQRTLSAIKRQAKTMEEQSSAINISAKAAEVSAQAAKTSADIAAGMAIPRLVINEFGAGNAGRVSVEAFFQMPRIKIKIKNHGQTPAFLRWWCLCFTCEDLPEIPVYDGLASGVILDKEVIEAGKEYTLPALTYLNRQEFSLEEAKAIVKHEKCFHAYGYVCYGDIFGNPLRRLKFCETVLNIYGSETICTWSEGFAPSAYIGTDEFPLRSTTQQ